MNLLHDVVIADQLLYIVYRRNVPHLVIQINSMAAAAADDVEIPYEDLLEQEESSGAEDSAVSPWTWSPEDSEEDGSVHDLPPDSAEDEMSDEIYFRVKPEDHPGYEYIFVAKHWDHKQYDIYTLPSRDGWKLLHWVSWLKIDDGIGNVFINCNGVNGAAHKPLDCICVELLCLTHHLPHVCVNQFN